MKDKIFGVLQRVGRSFMLPIAILPVAGLLLGIGSSFTNETRGTFRGRHIRIMTGIRRQSARTLEIAAAAAFSGRYRRGICIESGKF